MIPTAHTAKPAVTSKIGRFATLRGLPPSPGVVRLLARRSVVAAPLAALCVLLALCVGVAQAEAPKLVLYESFSAHEARAVGVAVEGSGDMFVSGPSGGRWIFSLAGGQARSFRQVAFAAVPRSGLRITRVLR